MTENYFKTCDFPLAAYLKYSNIDIREIEFESTLSNRCVFIFRIEDDSPVLLELLDNWKTLPKCKDFKRILYASKLLKSDLKNFLTKHKNG